MKRSNDNAQTFREKLYASAGRGQREKVDALLCASVRGSDRIEGIRRSSVSYEVDNPRNLPRVPREQR